MKHVWYLWILFGLAVLLGCRGPKSAPHTASSQPAQLPGGPTESKDQVKVNQDLFIKADRVSYNGYDVVKLSKRIPSYDPPAEVAYAAVRRNSKQIAEFDGPYFGLPGAVDFGLFPFLGGNRQQLLISATVPRSGRHWIVDLSSGVRVIFDSADYDLGREEVYVQDIDEDGVYEITLLLTAFWGFDGMTMAESPLPPIIFKYDQRTGKYIPASNKYPDRLLRGIDVRIESLGSEDREHYLSKRLGILLSYVYAGKQEAGWSFFERTYQQPDKQKVTRKIAAVLNKEPIYIYIYGRARK